MLVGFMGAGKTTVGWALARLLAWDFLDLDARIEERRGQTVAEVFARHGEAAFREEERAAAVETLGHTRLVIATGGGAFASPDTREALRRDAATVWLRCALATLLDRIPLDGSRPLAANHATIVRLLAEREPAYRLADVTVDTTEANPSEAARTIREVLFPGSSSGES